MNSFLITYKPATENPKRGWPIEELRRVIAARVLNQDVEELWRFHNRRNASIEDRVFLLLQGKTGPAIIGYGRVAGRATRIGGKWQVPIRFESLVDPTTHVLTSRKDLYRVNGGMPFWRTQASGVQLPTSVANALEELVVGKGPRPKNEDSGRNPDWTRDELILALDFYLRHRPNPPSKSSPDILTLSQNLNRLAEKLFPTTDRGSTFRNPDGVYMKLMNFRRLDPEYTAGGKAGLQRGAEADKDVWAEFAADPARCQLVAKAILAVLNDPENNSGWLDLDSDAWLQEAPEGRLLTRKHIARERNRQLVQSKINHALRKNGKLTCEVCEFDFEVFYGLRGQGFIECHHTKPVATLKDGHKTHINDLALVCANCHRMIHRTKRWLSVSELKGMLARGAMHN